MKKGKRSMVQQPPNPYEKIFDDANKLLKKIGGVEYLDDIPDNHEQENSSIPFPYGNNTIRPYNFN